MRHGIFLALLLVSSAIAPPVAAKSFGAVDRNNDGGITYDEARRSLNRLSEVHFDKCDYNGDGVIEPGGEFGCLSGIYDMLYRNRNR